VEHGSHGEVAQSKGKGVSRVWRLRRLRQPEQRGNHALHLFLGGGSVSGHSLLDRVRRVLHDLAAGASSSGQDEATRLADRHSRAHVDLEKQPLDRNDVGPQLVDKGSEVIV
jgi:hypothetical protein